MCVTKACTRLAIDLDISGNALIITFVLSDKIGVVRSVGWWKNTLPSKNSSKDLDPNDGGDEKKENHENNDVRHGS